jgi:hypothetical protein
MIEVCSCGGQFRSYRYARIVAWRKDHRHEEDTPVEPQKSGSYSSYERREPMGFMPGGSDEHEVPEVIA